MFLKPACPLDDVFQNIGLNTLKIPSEPGINVGRGLKLPPKREIVPSCKVVVAELKLYVIPVFVGDGVFGVKVPLIGGVVVKKGEPQPLFQCKVLQPQGQHGLYLIPKGKALEILQITLESIDFLDVKLRTCREVFDHLLLKSYQPAVFRVPDRLEFVIFVVP